MKKTAENRYPHSATLFRFCKEALELRYEGNVKVIDQDVGAILGYDPADCSHWKKGKKNIRALMTLKSIADHLHIDERLLIDITAGKIDLEEAVFEYKGYGQFALQGRHMETLKKDFFRNPTKWQRDGVMRTFEELFDVKRNAIVETANAVLSQGKFSECPIYLPEVLQLFPDIELVVDPKAEQRLSVVHDEMHKRTLITHRGEDMRPYVRFQVARELFRHLCRTNHALTNSFHRSPAEVMEVQCNIFAGMLLIPGKLLKREVERIDCSLDLVLQLSEIFWVSRSLMNQRLRDYMESRV